MTTELVSALIASVLVLTLALIWLLIRPSDKDVERSNAMFERKIKSHKPSKKFCRCCGSPTFLVDLVLGNFDENTGLKNLEAMCPNPGCVSHTSYLT